MRKWRIALLMAAVITMSGCAVSEGAEAVDTKEGKTVAVKEEEEFSTHVTSKVKQEDCCICGENEQSLMSYYRKSGMIGLVCLNTMNISNLDTRMYSDDGTELIDDGEHISMTTSGHGEGECCFSLSGMPNRGILEGQVHYGEKSKPDFDKIKKYLCQECLDKVTEMYDEEMNWGDGDGRFPEVCLVDFQTNELYPLGEHHIGYWIRDFWIHIDHKEDRDNVMAIYAPKGKMK